MISKLYKKVHKPEALAIKKDQSISMDIAKNWRGEAEVKDQYLEPSKVSSVKMLFHSLCPSKCILRCLKKNKSEDLYDKAMKYYEQEIDIIEMIRNFREIRIVLREFIMRK